jgi:hypothetical protein
MPPTSIDGTDITGATIDGQDVQEITVDGQTVFTATQLPIAHENLLAWYIFEDGGSAFDYATDTRIDANWPDNTAYDLISVNSPTHLPSGGVTDINEGANSGAFDFNNSNSEFLYNNSFPALGDSARTLMCWHDPDGPNNFNQIIGLGNGNTNNQRWGFFIANDDYRLAGQSNDYQSSVDVLSGYQHIACSYDGSAGTLNFDRDGGDDTDSISVSAFNTASGIAIATVAQSNQREFYDGTIDEVRVYNTDLSSSQISDIYQNTEP